MQWHLIDSRAVAAAAYDEVTRELQVRFHSGRSYCYEGVPHEIFEWLLRVPSKGAFFNRMIREGYAYTETTVAEDSSPGLEQALRESLTRRDG